MHRNPVRRGLVTKSEDWKGSSFQHDQTGVRGTVEIESEWTARQRGWQLPEWMRYKLGSSSPVPKSEGDRGHPQRVRIPTDIEASHRRGGVRGLPGLRIETWGTQRVVVESAFPDLGHPPALHNGHSA
jgi:hypothetical protein